MKPPYFAYPRPYEGGVEAGSPNRGVHSGEVLMPKMGELVPNYSRPRKSPRNAPVNRTGEIETVSA